MRGLRLAGEVPSVRRALALAALLLVACTQGDQSVGTAVLVKLEFGPSISDAALGGITKLEVDVSPADHFEVPAQRPFKRQGDSFRYRPAAGVLGPYAFEVRAVDAGGGQVGGGSGSVTVVSGKQVEVVVVLSADGLPPADGSAEAVDASSDAPAGEGAGELGGEPTDAPGGGEGTDTPGDATGDGPIETPIDAPPAPLGDDCAADGDCASGHCVDGVCCITACTGTCVACNIAGSKGVCVLVPEGADPHANCAAEDVSTCGRKGGCDGLGHCRNWERGAVCKPQSCATGVLLLPAECDGQGQCGGQEKRLCKPFTCNVAGSDCNESCTGAGECVPEVTCDTGAASCGKRPLGMHCAAAGDCASAHCIDGVCCESDCSGGCLSCALAGSRGACTPVPPGLDPDDDCAAAAAATCGLDGTCDGAGACRKYPAGSLCKASTCVAATGILTQASSCDGAGACVPGQVLSCGAYACDTGKCKAACKSGADCASGVCMPDGSCGKKSLGNLCASAAECSTGFCADGICCDGACGDPCHSCALPGSEGLCTLAPAGQDPRNDCSAAAPVTCGNSGLCDGAGACAKYPSGTICLAFGCAGSTRSLAARCDGTGTCVSGGSQSCAPFLCGAAGDCLGACTKDADCIAPNICVAGSCGKKPLGTSCAVAVDCDSGFCAQGVCCTSACAGTCRSCAVSGSLGTCTAVPAGQDPLSDCDDDGAASCDNDGSCDGAGSCRKYASGTVCTPGTCASGSATDPATCDGLGACRAGSITPCDPYACGATACNTTCTGDGDCAAGSYCAGAGACAQKKTNGAACAADGECSTGHCIDGACCESACTGACQACVQSKTGQGDGLCRPVSGGTDPDADCTDEGAPSCGKDGMCDGAGACRKYTAGTVCLAQSCTGASKTLAARCDGAGACVAGTSQSCAPYVCGATGDCLSTCTGVADCVSPNPCTGGSCGKKPLGAGCSGVADCASNHCEQGVCCATACAGTCQSCALAGSEGSCTSVPAGQDPLGQCADEGATTCGLDGSCDGAGACHKYAAGTNCQNDSCAGSTYSPVRTCNGTGTCQTANPVPCAPYVCGATACKSTCTTDGDCVAGSYCAGSSCTGKKGLGAGCGADNECSTGSCVDGVCCETACGGACLACTTGKTGQMDGLCRPVTAGTDPDNECTAALPATCGLDGSCDGAGACRKWVSGTVCTAQTCAPGTSTKTLASRCDGAGACVGAGTQSCAPYLCGAASNDCLASCSSSGDCLTPNVCDVSGSCGKKPLGTPCGTAPECQSGNCAQGVCCDTACTGLCKSCALSGSVGSCTNAPAGQDPRDQCADQGAASCGNDGMCDGGGACRNYPTGTVCQADSCSGTTYIPPRTCSAAGVCQTVSSSSCAPYVCGPTTCKVGCSAQSDCVSAAYCSGSNCVPKKSNGAACGAALECSSAFCVDGVCCEAACAGACQACAQVKTGQTDGLCRAVSAGTDPDDECAAGAQSACGQDGTCDGLGACRKYVSGTVCGAQTCSAAVKTLAARCDGFGACVPGATQSCSPYQCGGTDCLATCTVSGDCVSPNTCNAGSCGKKGLGLSCSDGTECLSGTCAQGVCCMTACSGTCRSCALSGSAGTCTNVPAGQDPLSQCNDAGSASCGTDGFCDGSAACRQYGSGTVCVAAGCAGSTFTPARTCNGTGTCQTVSTSSCGAYLCGGAACNTSCSTSADCNAGYYCSGSSCVAKKSQGAGCGGAGECATGFCVDGVCCLNGCAGACQACANSKTGLADGLCKPVTAGSDPDNECSADAVSTCGFDGTCDGNAAAAPACRKYVSGTTCIPQSCTGSTKTLPGHCDGAGTCTAGTTQPCAPYQCGASDCLSSCTVDPQCVSPNTCVGGSCGKKPLGATCSGDAECLSNACAQGVCCMTACSGTCKSCALGGSVGTCSNVPAGQDPLAQCADAGAATCGNDGQCDGAGACRNYGSGTPCVAESCAGATYTPPRLCNGSGTCQTVSTSSCSPYLCGPTQCKTSCSMQSDCNASNWCSGTSCVGKKSNGVACGQGYECTSGQCVDGVCCNAACASSCTACNIAGSVGTCIAVVNADDPDTCSGTSTCGPTGGCGKKNGLGCGNGTECASGSCPDGICCGQSCTTCQSCTSATGTCVNIGQYLEDNVPTNACTGVNSCDGSGACRKDNGQGCTLGTECASGVCADGVCCNATCTGSCMACNVAGSVGTCSQVKNQDDFDTCLGVNTCDGAGACKLKNGQGCTMGSQCASAACTDGVCCGMSCTTCQSCGGVAGTCSNIAVGGTDNVPAGTCVVPNACNGSGMCLLGNGQTCTLSNQCASNACVDGVCCENACAGTCMACAMLYTGQPSGMCKPVIANTDPDGNCAGALTCDGAGACRTGCTADLQCELGSYCTASTAGTCAARKAGGAANACAGDTIDPTGNHQCTTGACVDGFCCDGACGSTCMACSNAKTGQTSGQCKVIPANTDPDGECPSGNTCNGAGACRTGCTADVMCKSTHFCNSPTVGTCQVKTGNGTACNYDPIDPPGNHDCISNHCADGYCCNTACNGTCERCDTTPGTCNPISAGTDPQAECGPTYCSGASSCMSSCTGGSCSSQCKPSVAFCNAGVCSYRKSNGQACGSACDCTSTFCVDGVCCDSPCSGTCLACVNSKTGMGDGTCRSITAGTDPDAECGNTFCSGGGSCYSSCSGACDAKCKGAAYCSGTTCTADKVQGAACSSGCECPSGQCVDGVCCESSCTGTCLACSTTKTGQSSGLCRTITINTDPDAECAGGLTCDGAGVCRGACAGDGQCEAGYYCTNTSGGSCVAKKAPGASNGCGADPVDGTGGHQCTNGICTDGYCCTASCVGPCVACNIGGSLGTCTNRTTNTDPEAGCAGGLVCDGAGSCRASCAGDAQCETGYYCTNTSGGACTTKRAPGAGNGCGADPVDGTGGHQCINGICTDGYCCTSSCAGPCIACNIGGSLGTCANRTNGTDPEAGCGNYNCNGGGGCYAGCSGGACGNIACKGGLICNGGGCGGLKANGQTCGSPCECASAVCTTFWYDGDADGHGNPGLPVSFCGSTPPGGYVTNWDDCCDSDNRAYPGQTGFYTSARTGCGGYDYDCSGFEEYQYPNSADCSSTDCGFGCDGGGPGWDVAPPLCGSSGAWYGCRVVGPVSCKVCANNVSPTFPTAACH